MFRAEPQSHILLIQSLQIATRKLVDVEGVRLESDIWVEVNLGASCDSLFVFEWKNWEDKVSKNEVIVFSEKLNAVLAQRGFFVPKSFTRDAYRQAAKYPKMVLLLAKDLPVDDVLAPYCCVSVENRHAQVQFRIKGPEALELPMDIDTEVILDG